MLPRFSLLSLLLLLVPIIPFAAVAETPSVEPEPLLRVEGRLEDSDPTLSEDNTRYDEYQFTGQAGQTITIVLESVEFDTYLLLKSPSGQTIEQNDDYAEGNKNSAITITLPESGIYTLVANAYSVDSRGQYRLTVLTGSEPVFLAAEEQIRALEQTLNEYRTQGDRENEAEMLDRLGEAHRRNSQYPQALENYQQALEIYQSLNRTSDAARILYWIGYSHKNQAQYPESLGTCK